MAGKQRWSIGLTCRRVGGWAWQEEPDVVHVLTGKSCHGKHMTGGEVRGVKCGSVTGKREGKSGLHEAGFTKGSRRQITRYWTLDFRCASEVSFP